MDKVRISLNSPINGVSPIKVKSITYLEDNTLKIELDKKNIAGITENGEITFSRNIPRETSTDTIYATVGVLGIYDGYIITEAIGERRLDLRESSLYQYESEDYIEAPIEMIYTEDGTNLRGVRLNFPTNHNIFLQDLEKNNISLIGYSNDNRPIVVIKPNQIHIVKDNTNEYAVKNDTFIETKIVNCYTDKVEKKYVYLPDSFNTTVLFIETNQWPSEQVAYIIPSENPFYYKNGNNVILWNDPWGDNTIVTVNKNTGYWYVPKPLSIDANDYALGIDELERSQLANDLLDSAVPSIINMEKEKYVPIIDGDSNIDAEELEFNLHFRKRATNEVGLDEDGNINFKDGWYIDPEEDSGWYDTEFGRSDLVGCLGFTDNDVYYRKSKIRQSFLRLSFYTSTNPLEQRLLYYSTVFADSAKLYGKYIAEATSGDKPECGFSALTCNTERYKGRDDARIQMSFNITNEYDRMRSSEGFNAYFFADDATEGERTLYLKVEFNHAGFGKTIPMILPTSNNDGELKIKDFIHKQYIPVKICYKNGKYCYYFPDKEKYTVNDRKIVFTLFEPKIQAE